MRRKSAGLDDIRVRNETGEPQTVTVRVTRSATDEQLLAETRVVPTGEPGDERSIAFPDPIESGGSHRVHVAVENREPETYNWDVWGVRGQQDEEHSLTIEILPTEIEFLEGAV